MPLYIIPMKDGGRAYLRGDLGPHCAHCADVGTLLCDYPVGDGKTCDQALCEIHATELGTNLHYCPAHMEMWEAHKAKQGGAH